MIARGGGMVLVRCDFVYNSREPGEPRTCIEEFRSGSDQSVIAKQLELAGWTMRRTQRDGRQDFCPIHKGNRINPATERGERFHAALERGYDLALKK
jgi:hypothetical protein